MRYRSLVLLIFMFLTAGGVLAEVPDIPALKAEVGRMEAVRDSLSARRTALAVEAAELSARIDTLKAGSRESTASGALREALRRALTLADHLEQVDRGIESVRRDLAASTERLRAAYGGEIGALIGRLGEAPDAVLLQRLKTLQEARESLRRGTRVERTPSEETLPVIREDDGPDEIRQKADVVADMAARTAAEAQGMARRLKRLNEERRLRKQMSSFALELFLFDEALPEGRAVSAGNAQDESPEPPQDQNSGWLSGSYDDRGVTEGLAPSVPDKSSPVGGEMGAPLVAGREVVPAGAQPSLEDLSAGDLESEIQMLKRRQAALREREQALRLRLVAFRKRLEQMLEEGE